MEKIKPCKFCGGKAKVMYREAKFIGWRGDGLKGKSFYAYVSCNRCHARGQIVKTDVFIGLEQYSRRFQERVKPYKVKAIEAWNRRADE